MHHLVRAAYCTPPPPPPGMGCYRVTPSILVTCTHCFVVGLASFIVHVDKIHCIIKLHKGVLGGDKNRRAYEWYTRYVSEWVRCPIEEILTLAFNNCFTTILNHRAFNDIFPGYKPTRLLFGLHLGGPITGWAYNQDFTVVSISVFYIFRLFLRFAWKILNWKTDWKRGKCSWRPR